LLDSLLIEPKLTSWRVIIDDSYHLLIGIPTGECGARAHQDHLRGHPINQQDASTKNPDRLLQRANSESAGDLGVQDFGLGHWRFDQAARRFGLGLGIFLVSFLIPKHLPLLGRFVQSIRPLAGP
jgi:hypothetical protein